MQIELKKAIVKYIRKTDPDGIVVKSITPTEDWSDGTIQYNWDSLYRNPERYPLNLGGDGEGYVHAYLAVRLIRELGYPPNKTVAFEAGYSIGHPKIGAFADLLVYDKRDKKQVKCFFFIECKTPESYESDRSVAIQEQLFKTAAQEHTARQHPVSYLVYYTVRWENNEIREEAQIIDYEQYKLHEEWDAAGQPFKRLLPGSYETAIAGVYVNKAPTDLQKGELTLDRTKDRDFFSRLSVDLHDKLWGGSTEYNYIFKNLARLFLAKIYDELVTPPGVAYTFQVKSVINQKSGKSVEETAEQLFDRLNELARQSSDLLGYGQREKQKYGIEEDYIDAYKVFYVVTQLQGISLRNNTHARTADLLGDFFEKIISQGFKQSAGSFFTHKNIVYFVLYGLCLDDLVTKLATNVSDPTLPRTCDPACGSGTFLIEAMRIVTKHFPKPGRNAERVEQELRKWSTDLEPHAWAENYIFGIEKNPDLALSSKVNMVLHRDGNMNILAADGLRPFADYNSWSTRKNGPKLLQALKPADQNHPYGYERNEEFDIVVSNPPFSVSIDRKTLQTHRGRFYFAGNRNSEVLFIERYYQLLRENGRLGVVLPESVLDTAENLSVRLFLYKYFEIIAVVSLPYLSFQPFTSTKTCLLFARKRTKAEIVEYETAWREAAKQYNKLWRTPLIWWAVQNQQLRDSLMDLCVNLDVDFQIASSLLHPDGVPSGLQTQLGAKADQLKLKKWSRKKVNTLFMRIDTHFGLSPFRDIRQRSLSWVTQNKKMLDQVAEFAKIVCVGFSPDAHGHLSRDCFNPAMCTQFVAGAEKKDGETNKRSTKHKKAWTKLQKSVDKYLAKSGEGDAATDPEAKEVLLGFLKSLAGDADKTKTVLELLNNYLDDIARVSQIDDFFGTVPGKSRPTSFAHSNAWWVYEEMMHDERFRYDIFMAEAEEIGYKRKAGNRYDLSRPNFLFYCSDPERLAETIEPDRDGTLLAKLRAHSKIKVPDDPNPGLLTGFRTSTSKIGGQIFLRADPKYRFFWDIRNGRTLEEHRSEVRLGTCFVPYGKHIIPKGELGEERVLIELEDVEGGTSIILQDEEGNYRNITKIGSSKLDFGNCDLVFSRLRPYLGKVLVNQPSERCVGTTEWIPLKLRKGVVNPFFLKYLLLRHEFLSQEKRGSYWKLSWGKLHPRLSEWDLGKILIPLPAIEYQEGIFQRIRDLEEQMVKNHRTLKTRSQIIEYVFTENFGYSLDEYEASTQQHHMTCGTDCLTVALDLRLGTRFHHPRFDAFEKGVAHLPRLLFRNVIARPIRLGATASMKDFSEEGEGYYISPAVIKTYVFDIVAAKRVTAAYQEKNQRQFGLRENDLVIARSGEGTIGKAALFSDERICIHSDFTMRVRFNDKILPEFGFYFCCSKLFQLQVEKAKRGMGNMTNFFPSQLANFWILCPDGHRQEEIAERCRAAIESMDQQRADVQRLRDEIDQVIGEALMGVR